MSQFVYAIGSAWDRPVKIGVASDVARRLVTIQSGNPDDLQVLWAVLHEDAFALETHLHRTFAPSKVRGEWFRLSGLDEVAGAVASFNAAPRLNRAADIETRACVIAVQWMVDQRAARLGGKVEQAITDLAKHNRLKRHLVWQFRYKPPVKAFMDQYIAIATALWRETNLPAFDWRTDLPRPNEIIALVDIMLARALPLSPAGVDLVDAAEALLGEAESAAAQQAHEDVDQSTNWR